MLQAANCERLHCRVTSIALNACRWLNLPTANGKTEWKMGKKMGTGKRTRPRLPSLWWRLPDNFQFFFFSPLFFSFYPRFFPLFSAHSLKRERQLTSYPFWDFCHAKIGIQRLPRQSAIAGSRRQLCNRQSTPLVIIAATTTTAAKTRKNCQFYLLERACSNSNIRAKGCCKISCGRAA